MENTSITDQPSYDLDSKKFAAHLQCIECHSVYPIEQILYCCPQERCQGLLDVVQDIKLLKRHTALQWKERLQQRRAKLCWPFNSGVWLHKEWIHPQLREEHIVSLGEGNTPLLALPRLSEQLGIGSLWLKQCGISHTGSFKDLGMTVLVSHVKFLLSKSQGIRAIACASTGDTSAALSAYAAYANLPSIVFLPKDKVSKAQLVQPLACGSLVLSLQTDFDGCMSLVKDICLEQGIYLANSMNPLRLEGQKTMGLEVLQQLGWQVPDWFVIPGGNLGNVSALVAGMRLALQLGLIPRMPRVCVAQSANANPLYLSFKNGFRQYQAVKAKQTLASAIQIGDPISFPRAKQALLDVGGVVEQASEEELVHAAAKCDLHGMFNDPHTGVALACLEKLCKQGKISKTETVVVISTAHGLKFSETKSAYHNQTLAMDTSRYSNHLVELKADRKSILRILQERLPI